MKSQTQLLISNLYRHKSAKFTLGIVFFLFVLVATGCQTEVTLPPTEPPAMPSQTALPPTETPIPHTDTLPPPTETAPPPEPTEVPTQPEPEQPQPTVELVGYALNIPAPDPGAPSGEASTFISVRSGPALEYPVYGLQLEGQVAELVGISPDRGWYAIKLPDAPLGRGWVFAAYLAVQNAEGLPEIQAPPVPPVLEFAQPNTSESPYVRFRETVYTRSGPGDEHPVYGTILQGNEARTFAKTEDGEWWRIVVYSNLVPSKTAWVPDKFIEPRRGGAVAAVQLPPVPEAAGMPVPAEGDPSAITMAPIFLRLGPGVEYPALGVTPQGTPVSITGTNPNREWWQVTVPTWVSLDGKAWIAAPFASASAVDDLAVIEPPPLPQQVQVFEPGAGEPYLHALDTIIVYSGPGNEYNALGMLSPNNKAVVVGVSGDSHWYIIRVPLAINENGQGWVDAAYIEPNLQQGVPVIEPPAQ